MSAIRLTGFRGEQPKIIPRLLPDTGAQAAYNARLDDGALAPLRKSVKVATLEASDRISIYKHGDTWLSWDADVDAAPGPVASDRLYITGDGAPKLLAEGSEYPLAIAGPEAALTATLGGSGDGDVVTRLYVYTWVSDFGEESEPSPASAAIDWKPGNSVTLSGFAEAPTGRAIGKQRIYRSQTGQSGTYFYFIAERSATNSDFTDDVAVDGFAEALPSADWNPPPDGLKGLVAMPNGMMAAFSGKDLYFCEPWHPHAWPEKYVLTTDVPIVAIKPIGTALVVMTAGNPYLVVGSTPATMAMTKIEQNLPCINKRAVADLGYAICYPTRDGLVAVDASGAAVLSSLTLFGRYEWEALAPANMVAAQYGGRYVAFYDTVDGEGRDLEGAVLINVGQNEFLGRMRQTAQATYYDVGAAALYYVPVGSTSIYRFDAPEGVPDTLYWRSKPFIFGAPTNFAALRVDADGALSAEEIANLEAEISAAIASNVSAISHGTVKAAFASLPLGAGTFGGNSLIRPPPRAGVAQVGVFANGIKIAMVALANTSLRLPGGFTAEQWEVDVASSLRVTNIVMAETMDELKGVMG